MRLWERHRVIDALDLGVEEKELLRVLANHVRDDDPTCFLGQTALRAMTGIKSEKGIRNATSRLERRGLVTASRPKKYPGRGKAIRYTLHLGIRAVGTYLKYVPPENKYVPSAPEIRALGPLNTCPGHDQPLEPLGTGENRTTEAQGERALEGASPAPEPEPEPEPEPPPQQRENDMNRYDADGLDRENQVLLRMAERGILTAKRHQYEALADYLARLAIENRARLASLNSATPATPLRPQTPEQRAAGSARREANLQAWLDEK